MRVLSLIYDRHPAALLENENGVPILGYLLLGDRWISYNAVVLYSEGSMIKALHPNERWPHVASFEFDKEGAWHNLARAS